METFRKLRNRFSAVVNLINHKFRFQKLHLNNRKSGEFIDRIGDAEIFKRNMPRKIRFNIINN